MIYIFDLDGTVADLTHRLHFITGETKDWDGFHGACFGKRWEHYSVLHGTL